MARRHSRNSFVGRQNSQNSQDSFGDGLPHSPRQIPIIRRSSMESQGNPYEYLSTPPPTPNGEPIHVDFRCACFKMVNISTVDFSAVLKFVIVFEWNDARMHGTDLTTNDLPGSLWGPDIILENALADCQVIYDSFSLLDSQTGRLKRTVTFHGPVFNPMDLCGFPFDSDDLEMKFISICNWRSLDETKHGNDPVRRVYTLHPLLDSPTAPFFFLGWGGKVNEFKVIGWNHKIDNPEESSRPISFQFDFHLIRKVPYYYLKILFPMWLLVVTSLAAYTIDIMDGLGDRYEFLVTVLLATIAFLYIVQDSLPKVGFLTVIDKVVILSLISLVMSIFFCFIIDISSNGQEANYLLAIVNIGSYIIGNIILVGPPHYKHYMRLQAAERQSKKLDEEVAALDDQKESAGKTNDEVPSNKRSSLRSSLGVRNRRNDNRPSLADNSTYISVRDVSYDFKRNSILVKRSSLQHSSTHSSCSNTGSDVQNSTRSDGILHAINSEETSSDESNLRNEQSNDGDDDDYLVNNDDEEYFINKEEEEEEQQLEQLQPVIEANGDADKGDLKSMPKPKRRYSFN